MILHIFLWACRAGGVFMGEIVSVCSQVKRIHFIFQDIEKICSYRWGILVGLRVLQIGQDAAAFCYEERRGEPGLEAWTHLWHPFNVHCVPLPGPNLRARVTVGKSFTSLRDAVFMSSWGVIMGSSVLLHPSFTRSLPLSPQASPITCWLEDSGVSLNKS